ncbi:hypothetical protein SDC9_157180 [bioreactor metagenome]|uniref:Uncharacterized protein n=1 Tax=bioreactor metagenome TaxID=1076179 RepID=A0A645F6R9_9ZZZZ
MEGSTRRVMLDGDVPVLVCLGELRRRADSCVDDGGELQVRIVCGDGLLEDCRDHLLKHDAPLLSGC